MDTVGALRFYRTFDRLEDSQVLLALLRQQGIPFETNLYRPLARHALDIEPTRLEVWVPAADYQRVQLLEASLGPAQAQALVYNFYGLDEEAELAEHAHVAPSPALARRGGLAGRLLGRYWLLLLLGLLFLLSQL